jgi:phenylacetate-CoA ligase
MEKGFFDPLLETISADARRGIQLRKVRSMLGVLLHTNAFYRAKLKAAGITRPEAVKSLADFQKLPLTTYAELAADQTARPPFGANLTYSPNHYRWLDQAFGSAKRPLRWLDTAESLNWVAQCWRTVYRAAEVSAEDRILFYLSARGAPNSGALSGAQSLGALALTMDGLSSPSQLIELIRDVAVTVLVCMPDDALALADAAAKAQVDLTKLSIRRIIKLGTMDAGVQKSRQLITSLWGARFYDTASSMETGPWGFECSSHRGLHINEGEFIAEVIDPATGAPANAGELVLTNLGRTGMPVIRYRTSQVVELGGRCDCGRTYAFLEGGVRGRLDRVAR